MVAPDDDPEFHEFLGRAMRGFEADHKARDVLIERLATEETGQDVAKTDAMIVAYELAELESDPVIAAFARRLEKILNLDHDTALRRASWAGGTIADELSEVRHVREGGLFHLTEKHWRLPNPPVEDAAHMILDYWLRTKRNYSKTAREIENDLHLGHAIVADALEYLRAQGDVERDEDSEKIELDVSPANDDDSAQE